MNKIEKMKHEYESIHATDELKNTVASTLHSQKSRPSAWIINLCAATAAAAIFVTAMNFSPQLAEAAGDVPILSSIVKIVTLGKYENKKGGYDAKIVTPKIEGLIDKNLENKLNKDFKDNADALIAAYEKDVKELEKEYGDDTIHMGITSDYTVLTDNDDYLALDVYILYTAGSSSTKHTFYTIDKKSGKLLTLKGLFKPDSDYVTVLSKYIKDEMIRLNNEEGAYFWVDDSMFEGFKKIKPDQNFYINKNGKLVICFDKYDVAAGAQGSPEFEIPDSVVKDIIVKGMLK